MVFGFQTNAKKLKKKKTGITIFCYFLGLALLMVQGLRMQIDRGSIILNTFWIQKQLYFLTPNLAV
jgi:hypothetical protein